MNTFQDCLKQLHRLRVTDFSIPFGFHSFLNIYFHIALLASMSVHPTLPKFSLFSSVLFLHCILFLPQISSKVQVVEFVEAEPTKFLLATGDHKLHFKAATLEEKQQWVRTLRSAIIKKSGEPSKLSVPSVAVPTLGISNGKESPIGSSDVKQMNGLAVISPSSEWALSKSPSPQASPELSRKRSMSEEMLLGPPMSGETRGRSLSPQAKENDQVCTYVCVYV